MKKQNPSGSFTAQIVLTTKCNLGCKYCYMKNLDQKMSRIHIEKIINRIPKILDQYGCQVYHVSYFGGEPLVAWDLITEYDNKFKHDSRCQHRVIISNGLLLTEDKVKFIKDQNIGFSWSFDGIWNDINRVDTSNKGTLKEYLDKLDLIRQVSPYNCKTMVSPNVVYSMVENYRFLSDQIDIPNVDFSLVRDDIWKEKDIDCFSAVLHDLAAEYEKDILEGKRKSIGLFTLAWLDMIFGNKMGKRPFSCFSGFSGLGFMPDGYAYGCARFGSVKELPIYNYMEDFWNQENFELLSDPKLANPIEYESCKDCAIRLYCNGGCNYNHLKNNYQPLESICKLYKIIYRESLILFEKLKNNKIFIEMLQSCLQNVG